MRESHGAFLHSQGLCCDTSKLSAARQRILRLSAVDTMRCSDILPDQSWKLREEFGCKVPENFNEYQRRRVWHWKLSPPLIHAILLLQSKELCVV
jgi:hypothetical protein